jgi:carbamoyl-phosphate synthase/aspartate carbamoyltransferase/dihydroorotase
MPNTIPAITDPVTFEKATNLAKLKSRCDYAQYIGGSGINSNTASMLAGEVAGLKLYLDQTFGDLKLDEMTSWMPHFANWPKTTPLCVHAEGKTMAAAILLAAMFDRPIHICHVSRREEILVIQEAKERGIKVTCEVCPHHLFLSEGDIPSIGSGRAEVRPRLASKLDQEALWTHLDVIDCFATDHAPHTLAEKDSQNPPPGFPGLETIVPLLLSAVNDGRLDLEDVVRRLHDNPKRIFGIPDQPDTYVEVDLDSGYEIKAADQWTRCGWTPFEGWKARGKVIQVVLRGETSFKSGEVLATPGSGKNIRNKEKE